MEKHIVKRKGHTEPYDEKKVYASVYAACRNAHALEQESEQIADKVTKHVSEWIVTKDQVTSREIFERVVQTLTPLHKDAAFMYETHRDIA
ncbi:MAG: hypothetical protein A2806_03175 [Candidatus Terrybacteria bacterium RIFCSPHIGHO2_01_FULL_48_17]|uniref:ATP-cone domain-containing protein n=1 Tax=Candidatus Terrybacteria bacterium RIFCSPHIGHO2_01_FULL_48_17 TaxID=1802362 RepID=A0A1G2PGU4_9BACT|nr:MAG: hypothetical protein A2806_03175 [Candidatus Terrybacteria bacterium RIFCSPHIGHO2_01_FULL_48_17]OHA53235.1 MAG: hypothetical protein A3A30_04435 [Candidatus Terrybacteria bacterium RIFCSPLOWO2_01_FULL_48_14]